VTDPSQAGYYRIPESVTAETLVAVRRQCEAWIAGLSKESEPLTTFSLADLKDSNSVVVALMIALYRYAYLKGTSVVFVDIPVELRNIIEVSELMDVLPVEG
jgi:ABC-type transporter Mla MlaB component